MVVAYLDERWHRRSHLYILNPRNILDTECRTEWRP